MDMQVLPTKSLSGEITAPPSKSYSHRAFVIAALANGTSYVRDPLTEGDLDVTIQGLRAFGVKIEPEEGVEGSYIVEGPEKLVNPNYPIDCKNSGTSIRILSTLSAVAEGTSEFVGTFLQRGRPLKPLLDALHPVGLNYNFEGDSVRLFGGTINPGTITIPGDISSQFITAMLIVLPRFPASSEDFIIELSSPLVSAPYVDITLEMLKQFGIKIEVDKEGGQGFGSFLIQAGQEFHAIDFTVPGDFSGVAFPAAAAATVEGPVDVTINNLDFESAQGDKAIIDILEAAGAHIEKNQANRSLHVTGGRGAFPLQAINVDMESIPDCFPILCVIGACASGVSRLYNVAHVRLKETDRVAVMLRELSKMGVQMQDEPTAAEIMGASDLMGATFIADADHRIVMAMTVAALNGTTESTILDAEVVQDSYPAFWEDMKKIGAQVRSL